MPPKIAESPAEHQVNHATLFGLSRRYVAPSQFQVSLSPLTPASDPFGSPAGCLARPELRTDPADQVAAAKAELAILTWTMMAVDVLHPDAFLAVPVTPELVLDPSFSRTVRQLPCERLLLVLETARMGGRRTALDEAVTAARRFGIKVALRGNRLVSAHGFDAVLIEPTSAAIEVPVAEVQQVIAVDLRTDDDVRWAQRIGANLLEGPALVDPMTVAPVDVRRLNRA